MEGLIIGLTKDVSQLSFWQVVDFFREGPIIGLDKDESQFSLLTSGHYSFFSFFLSILSYCK